MSEKAGKITQDDFNNILFGQLGAANSNVHAEPAFGVDVSIVDLPGNMQMALTSDPLSLIPSLGLRESAWLSVHLMTNDMATTGQAPKYVQFVLNLPDTLSKPDFKAYWGHIHHYCKDIGVAITGGHTGTVPGQNSTIAGGGTMVTIAEKGKMMVSSNAKAGNDILVTKQCALVSAAILAMSFPETVKNACGKDTWEAACESFYQTSSLKEGILVGQLNQEYPAVCAMHDVTEGGVLGAVYEMAMASGLGVIVENDAVPRLSPQTEVCKVFGIEPAYCVGAGVMVMATEPEYTSKVIEELKNNGVEATQIGWFTDEKYGALLNHKNETTALPYYETDPYWAAFFKAMKEGWK